MLVLAFFRRLDARLRGVGFFVLAYLAGTLTLARGGLAGAGREYMLVLPILLIISAILLFQYHRLVSKVIAESRPSSASMRAMAASMAAIKKFSVYSVTCE